MANTTTTGWGAKLSGFVPLVVGVVILVLFVRSCVEDFTLFGSSSPPADRDILTGEGVPGVDQDDTDVELVDPTSPEGILLLEPRTPECPDEDGDNERHLQWTEPPPMCIDPEADYTATLETDRGDIHIDLDTADAPVTVNNFIFLARWGFYDNIDFHIVFPGDTVQAGRPPAVEGEIIRPGYTFEDENLPDEDEEPRYPLYSVSMGNTAEPDTNGAVFFIVSGTAGLREPIYSRFGQIDDEESQAVVDAIDTTGIGVPDHDGTPREPTTIETVTISED